MQSIKVATQYISAVDKSLNSKLKFEDQPEVLLWSVHE